MRRYLGFGVVVLAALGCNGGGGSGNGSFASTAATTTATTTSSTTSTTPVTSSTPANVNAALKVVSAGSASRKRRATVSHEKLARV